MENISYKELDLWIQEELSQHGEWLIDRFIDALERNKNVDSGNLIESFDYSVSAGSPGGGTTLTVTFPLYGRLAEVRSRRLRKSGTNRDTWQRKHNHKPKKVQWYNKNRYAGYGRLIRRLTAGMSEAELKRIRGILEEARARLSQGNG